MAELKDCIGKNVKISKGSITIKADDGKTCGIVRNITSLYDLQANKQMEFYSRLRKLDVGRKISIKNIIIKDGEMFVFRSIKSKFHYEKYGYFDNAEKQRAEAEEKLYNTLSDAGIEIIECIFA